MYKPRKTPAEKKTLSYKKDHVLAVEYPNVFRRYWPRRKAKAKQKERRQVRRILAASLLQHQAETRTDIEHQPVRREQVRKWPGAAVPLGERLQHRYYMRIYRTAWNFFKRPYLSERDKLPFIAFLAQLIQSKTEHTKEVAQLFSELLSDGEEAGEYTSRYDRRIGWLQAFLKDDPLWGDRLTQWIKEQIDAS
jgi:hypothetical protein